MAQGRISDFQQGMLISMMPVDFIGEGLCL